MRRIISTAIVSFGLLAPLVLPASAAPLPGERRAGSPDYLHVRSDLRKALTLMRAPAAPNVKREENAAAGFIAAAIRDVEHVASVEGLNSADEPAPEVAPAQRLVEVEHTLDNAWSELKKPESDWRVLPSRANAVQNVRDAQNRVLRAEAAERADH